ncbi:holin [Pseudonocardia sp. NPDC049635]|uniref:holin n=1 Tax=Pseudonocardia sp. NPDC049635 TaxID=3155506 RepID=UPI0033EF905E
MTNDQSSSRLFTRRFWTGAADRAIKSSAQMLILLWGADAGLNILTVDVPEAFGVAAGAAVLSLLTSVASGATGDRGTSSALPGGQ